MQQNIGLADRIIRAIAGVMLIVGGWLFLKNNWLGVILNISGGLALLTAVMGKSYVYKLLKITTAKSSTNNQFPPPPSQPM